MRSEVDRRRVAGALPVLAALVVAALLTAALTAAGSALPWWLGDLKVYQYAGELLREGSPLYAAPFVAEPGSADEPAILLWFTYPPFAALLFAAVTALPLPVLGAVWQGASLLALMAVVWITLGVASPAGRRLRFVLALTPLLLFLNPVIEGLVLGQASILLMLLVLADLARPAGSRWRGVGVGLAAGIKVVPGIFIVYLFLTGQRREALTATATFLATVLIGLLVLPADSWHYWTSALWDTGRVGEMHLTFNQSLHGVAARVLHTGDPGWVGLALSALALAAGLAVAVRLHRRGFALEGVLATAVTALLVSPIAWHHHWSWLVPVLVLVYTLARRARSVRMWTFTILLTVLYTGGLYYLASPYPTAYPSGVAGQLLGGVFVIGGLLLLAAGELRCRRSGPARVPALVAAR